jgi:hypothetical protein
MLVICPTADYEIYLGKNFLPVGEVLFEPTRKLLAVFDDFDIRCTLFPDICSVWRHRELGVAGYADEFEEQIREAALAGHDVQLHLHPEWRTAERRDGDWVFRSGTHALHDLGFDTDDPLGAPALIRRGKQYLERLLRTGNPDYRCLCFRAGGWLLRPEAQLISALVAEDIRVDATVIPGLVLLRTDYSVDFRDVPDRPNWYVDAATGLGGDSGRRGDLLEVTIGSYRGRFREWQHAVNELRLRRRAKAVPKRKRGFPIVKAGPKPGLVTRLKNRRKKLSNPRVLDIADTYESMLTTVTSYLRHFDCRENDFAICMSGHPKDTYDYHLVELRRFLGAARTRYADVVRFETLSRFYETTTGEP